MPVWRDIFSHFFGMSHSIGTAAFASVASKAHGSVMGKAPFAAVCSLARRY